MCALSAKKTQIKEAFNRLYNTKVRSINTMITPGGKKKAYIRLSANADSLSLANKIGII
jgi:large subunit ribosomal protein L23Ae